MEERGGRISKPKRERERERGRERYENNKEEEHFVGYQISIRFPNYQTIDYNIIWRKNNLRSKLPETNTNWLW
jgi:hypothetical protein